MKTFEKGTFTLIEELDVEITALNDKFVKEEKRHIFVLIGQAIRRNTKFSTITRDLDDNGALGFYVRKVVDGEIRL